jgi:O-antigen/teichoic acid export membrane protein
MSAGTSRVADDAGAPFPAARRTLASRVSWGLADQAVSSLTNFAVGLVVARTLGAVDFGIFALAWAAYGGALNISRGLASDPFVIRYNGVSDDVWRSALRRATGTAMLVGVAAGALGVAAGLAVGGPLGTAFAALGVVMPALLVQDAWRFGFFAAGRGGHAFANDAVWAVALVPGLVLATAHGSVVAFVLAWGGAAAVAAVVGCFQARAAPHLAGVPSWLRDQRDLGPRYVLENISNSGAGQIRVYGLGAIAGLVAVGSVRGAELLLGPFLAVLMGLGLVAVPEAARVARSRPARLPRFCLLLGGVQAVAALVWGLSILAFLPDAVGTQLLGEVWPAAAALILPATLSVTFAGVSSGASTGLRALGAARLGLRAQLFTSVMYITGGLIGAAVNGAVGSSWGVAIGCLLGSVAWWVALGAAHRFHTGPPTSIEEKE